MIRLTTTAFHGSQRGAEICSKCLTMARGDPSGILARDDLESHIPLNAGHGAWSKSARWQARRKLGPLHRYKQTPRAAKRAHLDQRAARPVCCSRLGVRAVRLRYWSQSKFGPRSSSTACWLDKETSEHTRFHSEMGVSMHAVLPRLSACC